MKIAMVSPYSFAHPGGVNNHLRGLAGEMVRRGHQVTIIAPEKGDVPPSVQFISTGRSFPVPANGSIAWLALLPGTGARVKRALKSAEFDVVHVHEPLVPPVSTSAVRAAPCWLVGTFHAASDEHSATHMLAKVFLKGIFERLDSRIAVSESAKKLISTYFQGDYEIIPNGVDIDRFNPDFVRPDGMPTPGVPVILFVGRNEKRKGLSLLLDALLEVVMSGRDCHLVVVGEGFEEGKALPGVKGALRDNITVLGYIKNDELPGYVATADILCAPSLRGESFGIILIEAMACGTPVVASDIRGYRDVVNQTGGGLLFKAGDPASLKAALLEMIDNKDHRVELARKGLEGVGMFSWKSLGDRIEDIYRDGVSDVERT